ncbi:MAG: metallophosphoesterase [Eubacterium sp.]|nr:metallophosphoesterase [Eubacterium sp.]MDE6155215.1 metallophosphoesterase [Eubacterium sp.]
MSNKAKVKKTPKQKFKVFLKVLMIIILVIALLCGILASISAVGNKSNKNFISTIEAVSYENQLEPILDDNGFYTFITDDNFKVVQLTDVHIGGGFMSTKKDSMAINAVAAMLSEEKPDLVVVTGDIAYPVPFQAGTFNNKSSAKIFADLMEQLGVYWCPVFGNHDTEAYSFYSRKQISEFYAQDIYEHCLFQPGLTDVDGYGNCVINVKNTKGEITQSLFMMDSHSYVDGDFLGILWKYDTFHENQVKWYEDTLNGLKVENNNTMPNSLVFFHIAIPEYKEAWDEYKANNFTDTDNVKYIYGKAGEKEYSVYTSEHNYGFFDKAKELSSTQGMFCGHDHLNNFQIDYKGIKLSYGYSIDYLAYTGIMKFGLQRGCTVIDIAPDGTFNSHLENYYQDKYKTVNEKETVNMNTNYHEEITEKQQ